MVQTLNVYCGENSIFCRKYLSFQYGTAELRNDNFCRFGVGILYFNRELQFLFIYPHLISLTFPRPWALNPLPAVAAST